MKALLIKLILCFLTLKSYGQEEVNLRSQGDRIKDHLERDPTTLNILGQVYAEPLTPEMRNLLHLSLNNLLISSEILTSTDPSNHATFPLPQVPDFIQRENEEILDQPGSDESRTEYQTEYKTLSSNIAALIDIPFETTFKGGRLTKSDLGE